MKITNEQLDYYGDLFQGHRLQKEGYTFEQFLDLAMTPIDNLFID